MKRKRLRRLKTKIPTPLKAIRLKCLDCSAGSYKKVRLCPVKGCPLHFYRFGRNPHRKGVGGNPKFKKQRKKRA